MNFAGRAFYQLGIAGFKAALCISYLRLLAGSGRKGYTLLVWAVMIISTLGHIAGTLILILRCQPVCQPALTRHLEKYHQHSVLRSSNLGNPQWMVPASQLAHLLML